MQSHLSIAYIFTETYLCELELGLEELDSVDVSAFLDGNLCFAPPSGGSNGSGAITMAWLGGSS